MVQMVADNTAVRMLRNQILLTVQGYEERMLREVARMKEEAHDLDTEVKEGMSNRVADGFQAHESQKYADRVNKLLFDEAIASFDAIRAALTVDRDSMLATIVGTKSMPLEQSELAIVKIPVPGLIETPDLSPGQ